MSFVLSTRGLSFVNSMPYRKDFKFIVGEHAYSCHYIMADFLSPVVAMMHLTDPYITSFAIDIDDNDYLFENVMKLISGESIDINQDNCDFYYSIGNWLGNVEIINTSQRICENFLTNENVISRVIGKHKTKSPSNPEIQYLAVHFSEFKYSMIKKIPFECLVQVLQQPNLKVESETWMFTLISGLVSEFGSQYKVLLDFIPLEALNESEIAHFITLIDSSNISPRIWQSICQRLMMGLKSTSQRTLGKTYEFVSTQPFSGILSSLTNECGGNIHLKGVVEIISSSSSQLTPPHKIADKEWTTGWFSDDKEDSWILFNFKAQKVRISYYAIKTLHRGPNNIHLKSWVLEGSNDGNMWQQIDKRENNCDLNGRNRIGWWKVEDSDPYNMIKLKQTGRNHAGTNTLMVSNIEFFGTVI